MNEIQAYEILEWYGYEEVAGAYIIQDSSWKSYFKVRCVDVDMYVITYGATGNYLWRTVDSPARIKERNRRMKILTRINRAMSEGCICYILETNQCPIHEKPNIELRAAMRKVEISRHDSRTCSPTLVIPEDDTTIRPLTSTEITNSVGSMFVSVTIDSDEAN